MFGRKQAQRKAQPANGESYPRKPRQVLSSDVVRTMCWSRSAAQFISAHLGFSSACALFGHSVSKLGRPLLALSTVFIAFQVVIGGLGGKSFRAFSRSAARNVQK